MRGQREAMADRAIYAGTFDPLTLGHLDLIARAARVFPELILAVAESTRKETFFTLQERVDMARESVASLPNVKVESFRGLLVEYARMRGARIILRGLRAVSDFQYEFEMALTNRKLAPEVETMFLMPKQDFSYISSSSIREIVSLGGNVDAFVPAPVRRKLEGRLGKADEEC